MWDNSTPYNLRAGALAVTEALLKSKGGENNA
jgi:hypothetical protein